MGQILTSIHGRLLGLDRNGRLVNKNQTYYPGASQLPPLFGSQRYIFVCSVNGSSVATGEDDTFPISTLDGGINAANAGDVIVVLPGHTETITAASGVDIDKDNLKIIGLGYGTQIPTIEFNHADATVTVDADNIYIENIRFNSSITSVTVGVDVIAGATDCIINRCIFDIDLAATDEFGLCVRFNAGCHNGAVYNSRFDQDLAAGVAAISITGASDNIQIIGNKFWGDYSTAVVNGITTLSTNVDIGYNLMHNGEGGNIGTEPAIELLTGTTGTIYNNYIVCNLATKAASIVADTCFLFENYYNEDVTGTGGLIGTVSADD